MFSLGSRFVNTNTYEVVFKIKQTFETTNPIIKRFFIRTSEPLIDRGIPERNVIARVKLLSLFQEVLRKTKCHSFGEVDPPRSRGSSKPVVERPTASRCGTRSCCEALSLFTLGAEQIPVISVRSNHGQKNVQCVGNLRFLMSFNWRVEWFLLRSRGSSKVRQSGKLAKRRGSNGGIVLPVVQKVLPFELCPVYNRE